MAYPVVAASSTYNGDLAATHNLTLPTGTVAGSKILIFAAEAGLSGVVIAIEHAATQGEVDQGYLVYSPTSTDAVAAVLYRVTGAAGFASTPDEAGTGTQPDPPSAGTASGDVLWISVASWIGDIAHSSYSANYSGNQRTARFSDATNGVGIAVCTRNLTDSSDDPGPHTIASIADWGAITVTISSPDAAEGSGACVGVGVIVGAGRCPRSGSGTCDGDGDTTGGGQTSRSGSGTCLGVGRIEATGRCVRSGAGSISCTGAVIGDGRCQRSGSGEITCVGMIVGAGRCTRSGSGTVLGVGSIIGTGYQPKSGYGNVVGVGSLFGSGAGVKQGSGSVTAVGVIVGASANPRAGAGAVVGVGSLFGSGCACSGSGSVAGVGTLVGVGAGVRQGSGSVTAVGTIVGAGSSDRPTGSGVVLGVGTIVGVGAGVKQGSGAVVGVGLLDGIGKMPRYGSGSVVGVGLVVGAGASTQPNGSGAVLGIGSLVGVGQSIRSGFGSVVGVGVVVVGAGSVARSGSSAVVGVGVIVGAAFSDAPEGAGAVVGVGALIGAGRNTKSGSGSAAGIGTIVGAASLSRCTLGTVDISVNPSLVTVTNPAGFTVGRAVRFKNAKEIGVDLLATIAAVSGNQITLAGSAGVSVTDEICFISTSGKWFGPGGEDCGCGCSECYCEAAMDYYGDTELSLTGMPGSSTWQASEDIQAACLGNAPVYGDSFEFPGFANQSLLIERCTEEIGINIDLEGLERRHWGGTTQNYQGRQCVVREAIIFGTGLFGSSNIPGPGVSGGVQYFCDEDGVKQRRIYVRASYTMSGIGESIQGEATYLRALGEMVGDPDWSLVVINGLTDYQLRHTAESAIYDYWITYARLGAPGSNKYLISLELIASSTQSAVETLSLANAPAFYDPFGLMQGTVSLV